MRAILLAAGEGTRLRPLTQYLPKPVVPFLNRPLACQSLDVLCAAGVREVVVNAHHLADVLVRELTPELERRNLRFAFSIEEELLGTGGGVRRALELADQTWGATSEDVFIMNGDISFRPNLTHALTLHRQQSAEATMIVVKHADVEKKGAVSVRGSEVIGLAGAEKTPISESDARFLFSGTHILSQRFVRALPAQGCIVRLGYVPTMLAHANIRAYVSDASFWDLGTPEDYLHAQLAAIKERGGESINPSNVADATQSVIGDNVYATPGVSISHSVVWPRSQVSTSLAYTIHSPWFSLQVAPG